MITSGLFISFPIAAHILGMGQGESVQSFDEAKFLASQFGVPEIDHQHYAALITIIPDFMLEGVVEDEAFALLPDQGFVAHAQTAAFGHFDPEVAPQSHVG